MRTTLHLEAVPRNDDFLARRWRFGICPELKGLIGFLEAFSQDPEDVDKEFDLATSTDEAVWFGSKRAC